MNKYKAVIFICTILGMIEYTIAARYLPKWKKQACEFPALQNDQSHYTCDDNGDVKCLAGRTNILSQFIYVNVN